MAQPRPPVTSTTHTLPFDKLSPRDFERLCLWLIEREGWERAEHLGAAGSEQGRDIIAWREGKLWAFQCKRVQRFGPKDALAEVEKVLALPQNQCPVGLVFIVTCDVSANTRQQVRERCAGEMGCHFWTGTELDARAKRSPDIVEEFFQIDRGRSQAEELHDYLARAVATYEARMYQLLARPATPLEQPYKFLYAFEIEDADIFSGRDAASEALHQTMLNDRLTILHAKSGAGKTSLLNAGLSPRLIREGRLPVYARAYEDPVLAIKRAVAPPSLGPWPEPLPNLTLHEFLGLTCAHFGHQPQELVITLDQFEEFFIFWPERDHRQPFIDALADCYDDKALPVRFIIALRKDYYSDLATCQSRLPHIFHNEYYLDAMTREEAEAAITGPVAKLSRTVTYEPVLLDTLLDDLARGGMELPHLQIVCTRIYKALAEEETIITMASYEKLGRAEGVLGSYLNNVLGQLPGRGETVAKEVLKELVSSEATKRVLSYGTLVVRVEAEENELENILTQLVDARLLRRDEVAGEIVYEMAHEHLIEEIEKWIDQSDLEFKQAEELLAREVKNWHVHRTLIPRDRLELLYRQRERFRELDDETKECILRSALRTDFPIEDWDMLARGVGEDVLLEALGDTHAEIRRAATRELGAIWVDWNVSMLGNENEDARYAAAKALGSLGNSQTVEPLTAALLDEDKDVREAAARALGHLGDSRAWGPLITVLEDKHWRVRLAATTSLVRIDSIRAVPLLIDTLHDEDIDVRRFAVETLGEIGDSGAVEPLTNALRWDEDDSVCQAAVEALGRIRDPSTLAILVPILRDQDWSSRRAAAEALGYIGDTSAAKWLIDVLTDEDRDVRVAAARALSDLGDSHATEPLTATLQDEDSKVRQYAAEAMGKIGDPRAIEPLITALGDEQLQVSYEAIRALVRIGEPAVEALIVALRDEDSNVRFEAAGGLGELGDPRAVTPLIAALRDQDSNVGQAASTALRRIGTPEALAALEGS